jgi:hypothetical protein
MSDYSKFNVVSTSFLNCDSPEDAIKYGSLYYLNKHKKTIIWKKSFMDLAARFGQLEVVKWLHENRTEGCTVEAMNKAASNGHLEVVKWLHENRTEGCTVLAMEWAAENGHLEVVKWLHENRTEGCTKGAMDKAAEKGHLEVLFKMSKPNKENIHNDNNNMNEKVKTFLDRVEANGPALNKKWLYGNKDHHLYSTWEILHEFSPDFATECCMVTVEMIISELGLIPYNPTNASKMVAKKMEFFTGNSEPEPDDEPDHVCLVFGKFFVESYFGEFTVRISLERNAFDQKMLKRETLYSM